MMNEDPWSDIEPPTGASLVNSRRVEEGSQWPFYWMVDSEKRRLLGLRHSTEGFTPPRKMPKLRGVDVYEVSSGEAQNMLVFRLLDSNYKSIFRRLCVDIVSSTFVAKTEQEAGDAALARTWHWHRLLKGGPDGRLSVEEQKGLIGEINVIQEHLFAGLTATAALEAWTGPFGAPKDFEIGAIAIEAKARRGGAEPFVRISSEHQLDGADFDRVFLHVVSLVRPGPDESGHSVTDFIRELRGRTATIDISAMELLEARLAAVGFQDRHDYSDSLFVQSGVDLFEVRDGFPRVTGHEIRSGVSKLSYSIGLIDCEPFTVGPADLQESIGGLSDE